MARLIGLLARMLGMPADVTGAARLVQRSVWAPAVVLVVANILPPGSPDLRDGG